MLVYTAIHLSHDTATSLKLPYGKGIKYIWWGKCVNFFLIKGDLTVSSMHINHLHKKICNCDGTKATVCNIVY